MSDPYPDPWYLTEVQVRPFTVGHRFPVGSSIRDRKTRARWHVIGMSYVIGAGRQYHLAPLNGAAAAEAAIDLMIHEDRHWVQAHGDDVERHCVLESE